MGTLAALTAAAGRRGRGLSGSLSIQRCRLEFLNSSAAGEGSCGSGRGTWCRRGLHTASRPGEKGSPGWKCPKSTSCIPGLLARLPAAGCEEGGMGWSMGLHRAGGDVLCKVLAAGPRQCASLVYCEFPQTGEIQGELGSSDFFQPA